MKRFSSWKLAVAVAISGWTSIRLTNLDGAEIANAPRLSKTV
jgi:hypothetical protein